MAGTPPRSGDGAAVAHAGWSRRHIRNPDGDTLNGQVAIEQDFFAKQVHPHRRTQGLIDTRYRRQTEARRPSANDNRRYNDMEPIEASCSHEARYRIGSALDQNAAEPPC